MSEYRLTREEVDALWSSGQIRPWSAGTDLATPRGAAHFDRNPARKFVDFSMEARNERLREARRQRLALEALEGS
jgi:hypothetical protein